MLQNFEELNHIYQALLATLCTWFVTALGAAMVFTAKNFSRRILGTMLGFAGGVMLSASFFSLLLPAISMVAKTGRPGWLPAAIGFLAGGFFIRLVDRLLPHLHLGFPTEEAEGVKTSWRRSGLLFMAITLHNIPEGLTIGVAFGALASGNTHVSFAAACALAIGIGIQDFPEGMAVSLPLRREGMSRLKSFWYGQLSGMVEPIAGVIGAATVILAQSLLPYAMSFAAGAMIFVVVEEVIPESQREGDTDLATIGLLIGFVIMMILDVALS
jgi:zinc transporter, ZIP family